MAQKFGSFACIHIQEEPANRVELWVDDTLSIRSPANRQTAVVTELLRFRAIGLHNLDGKLLIVLYYVGNPKPIRTDEAAYLTLRRGGEGCLLSATHVSQPDICVP